MKIIELLASWWGFCYAGRNITTKAAVIMVVRPDYAAMAQEVEAMAAQEGPRFHGDAREEVEIIFKNFQAALELADAVQRRVPSRELTSVRSCVGTAQDALPDLMHYEVDPAVIQRFEEMQSDLNAWEGELRVQGQAPSGPASAPL